MLSEEPVTEFIMLPQVASGCLTPRPRKLSVPPDDNGAQGHGGVDYELGHDVRATRWRKMRREARMPVASSAIMNSCSRRESICPRTSLGYAGPAQHAESHHHPDEPHIGSILSASKSAPMMIRMG